MNKDIKDYLHLYLGCECTYRQWEPYVMTLIGVEQDSAITWDKANGRKVFNVKEVKLILRPLSDMTDYDKLDRDMFAQQDTKPHHYSFAKETLWYCKNSFDVFGLIESGLSIDKTTLNY